MFWRIMPHATACIASDKIFLLDLRQDRYFLVPGTSADPMFAWLHRGYACAAPGPVLALLVNARIKSEGDPEPTNALKERVSIPPSLTVPASPVSASAPHPARIAAVVMSTWLKLRLTPLHAILATRASRLPAAPPSDGDVITSGAAEYERLRSYTPVARNCLLDSLALDSWLSRRGLSSTLVFGVAAGPFAAHCWLQTPHAILNDSFDHVSRFTPIFTQ